MKKTKTTVTIIGAGLAGLAAGALLKKHGFDVTILEARDRSGGRIWVDHSLGVPISKGATWVHGFENNPIMPLTEQFPTNVLHMEGF
ncbi:MAG: FAD-dependent oxidoreductase [Gammaproteobacteria bacterium]